MWLHCGNLLRQDERGQYQTYFNQYIRVEQGKIAEITSQAPKKIDVDLSSHVVFPGLVNAHTHLAMSLFKGVADDLTFHEWLFNKILPLEQKRVDSEFVRLGSELAALECIRYGVTTVCDMYFHQAEAAPVWDRAGVRAFLGEAIDNSCRDIKPLLSPLMEYCQDSELVYPALAPHAIYTVNEDLFKQTQSFSEKYNLPIFVHVSETKKELDDSLKEHNKTPVQRLHELGIQGPNCIYAHGIWLQDQDIDLLKQSGTSIVHNPESNLKLGSGIAPVSRLLKEGVNVVIGTDGSASSNNLNILAALNTAGNVQKNLHQDGSAISASDLLSMATKRGQNSLSLQGLSFGEINIGSLADLVAMRVDRVQFCPSHSLLSHLIYSASGLEMDFTMCQGKILMEKSIVRTLDEEAILRKAQDFVKSW